MRAQHDAREKEAQDGGEVEAAEYRYGDGGGGQKLEGLRDTAYDGRVRGQGAGGGAWGMVAWLGEYAV